MPGEGANRLAQIARALQWDRGRWIWLLAIVLSLDLVLALGDNIDAVLRYDRGAIAAGGWWRLLTAHMVHLDLHHLVLNELGLVLMWALFAEDYDAVQWCVIVCAGALAISCGLWWLSPRVTWYVGASGVLHSVMAAGVAKHLLAGEWDREHAQKRGGYAPVLSIDQDLAESRFAAELAHRLQPDVLFDRQWAMTLLERTLAQLQEEYVASGRAKLFEYLQSCLAREASALPYAEIAARLNLTEAAVKMAVHRLRNRYREILRAEIAHTVSSPEEVEEEIRLLFSAFGP